MELEIFVPININITETQSLVTNADLGVDIQYQTRWLTLTSYIEATKDTCGVFWSEYSEINSN